MTAIASPPRTSWIVRWTTPLEFPPGTAYEYSNVGHTLLGMVAECVTGMGYIRYLHDPLLVPAGLQHAGYDLPSGSEVAVGCTRGGARWGAMPDQPMAHDGPGWHLRATGGKKFKVCSST